MTNTYYSSLTGMIAASYGLQNTSNNISNMQSHGFKRNDVFYSSLGNEQGEMGQGVRISGSSTNFAQGQYTETSRPSNLAVVGPGFFIIRLKNNTLAYTRNGNFEFVNGVLMDQNRTGEIQGYDKSGNLTPIHEQGPKTSPGKASHQLFVKGEFVLHEKAANEKTETNKYKNIIFELDKIYDEKGKAHKISFEFQSHGIANPNDPNKPLVPDDGTKWELINITCDGEKIDFTPQDIVFSGIDSGPSQGENAITFSLNGKQDIKLNFGDGQDGTDHSVTLKKDMDVGFSQSSISIEKNDGYSVGKQIGFSFDTDGLISYQYDNGQSIKGIHVGLARFDDMEHNLIQTHDNLFTTKTDHGIHFGTPNQHGFGFIQGNRLENSNVDATVEFANIVVLQRMFQACSQIMDIDKQLIEDLESKS